MNTIKKLNLQDRFLEKSKSDKIMITVFLISGYQIKGVVTGFDQYIIMLLTDGKQQMIYKHAVSTVIPSKYINIEEE